MSKIDSTTIEKFLSRGVAAVYPSKEDVAKRLKSGEILTMYFGIDPTGPTLHLGHAIALRKLQEFQNLGHKVILLIGDFTGTIGDPSGKDKTRVPLTREKVLENAARYQEQASKFLRFDGENAVELRYNSEWQDKLTWREGLDVAAHFTVQQLLERDMFQRRLKEGKPIHAHEFMYPVLQAYDSVALEVDGEIGGNDQTFNMLAGRTLMKIMSKKDKFIITMKLLEDSSGTKMGKSEGNMVSFEDDANQTFGKIMSWTDEMIAPAFELLTNEPLEEINSKDPRGEKERLAREVVSIFFDEDSAQAAVQNFNKTFKSHEKPEDIADFKVKNLSIIDILVDSGLASSKSDARRLIEGGGIKVNDQVIEDIETTISKPPKEGVVLQKGKRHFIRLK